MQIICKIAAGALIVLAVSLVGCAQTNTANLDAQLKQIYAPEVVVSPEKAIAQKGSYYCEMYPVEAGKSGNFTFRLLVRNMGDKDLIIDWNETVFSRDGVVVPGFIEKKRTDILGPGMEYHQGITSFLPLHHLAGNEVGTYLTLRQGDQVFREKLYVSIKLKASQAQ